MTQSLRSRFTEKFADIILENDMLGTEVSSVLSFLESEVERAVKEAREAAIVDLLNFILKRSEESAARIEAYAREIGLLSPTEEKKHHD